LKQRDVKLHEDAANDLALLKAVGRFAPLPIAASRTVKLGGTVAWKSKGRMQNEETGRQPARDGVNSSFILLPSSFPHGDSPPCAAP
jgi:hypothetical protein